jgi:hypothetical protein
VETLRRDILEGLVERQLDLDLGIAFLKGGEPLGDRHLVGDVRQGQPDRPLSRAAGAARVLQRRAEFRHGGPRPRQ